MARPPKEINEAQLCALLRMKPTLEDVAAFFQCSDRTIERYIKDNFEMTFRQLRDQEMVHTRHDLIRSAIEKSQKSDTMHIFCLKNLCGWRDKQPGEEDKLIVTPKSKEEIDARIQELLKKKDEQSEPATTN